MLYERRQKYYLWAFTIKIIDFFWVKRAEPPANAYTKNTTFTKYYVWYKISNLSWEMSIQSIQQIFNID